MPWAVLLRVLLRFAAALFTWRLVTARRGATAAGGQRPLRRPQRPPGLHPHGGLTSVREGASLAWRAVAMTGLLAMTALVTTGGVTTVVLGPRWLGGVLIAVAILLLAAAIAEGVALGHLVAFRRKRRHDDQLRREL